jgi:arsenite methyltransferase
VNDFIYPMILSNCLREEFPVEIARPGGLALTEHALEMCPLSPDARIFDLGCGSGATLRRLREDSCVALGIDASLSMLRRCNPGLTPVVQGIGENLPVASGVIDVILAECVLSVLGDLKQAVKEINRLLIMGGCLIFSDVYARDEVGVSALRQFELNGCLKGMLTRPEIASILSSSGFELEAWEDHSEALRVLSKQLIRAYATPPASHLYTTGSALDFQLALLKAKPGYYLAIGRKMRELNHK